MVFGRYNCNLLWSFVLDVEVSEVEKITARNFMVCIYYVPDIVRLFNTRAVSFINFVFCINTKYCFLSHREAAQSL